MPDQKTDKLQKDFPKFHTVSSSEVFQMMKTSLGGINSIEAENRRLVYGENMLPSRDRARLLFVFLKQFNSALIYILLVAAGISFFFNHRIDAYVILGIVFIDVIMGFVQEYRAGRAIEALKKAVVFYAKVYRNGELVQLPTKELVPGDLILLEEGTRVPADIRLVEVHNFQTIESSLTGESLPVDKIIEPLPEKISTADMKNCAWMGTFVSRGQAKGVVFATGASTALGAIAEALENIKIEKSHFQEKADTLAKQMGTIAIVMAILVFAVGYFVRGFELFDIFLFAVASLVSGIPEGLPAILVVVLALGAWRMSKQKAIVRSLSATETLGIVDVIITDKTGTLTQNTMTVERIDLARGNVVSVTGNGWVPKGEFLLDGSPYIPLQDMDLAKLLHVAGLCTNSRVYKKDDSNEYSVVGDPTEAALVVLAEKSGIKQNTLFALEKVLNEEGFNAEHKARGALLEMIPYNAKGSEVKREIYIAGAPEEVLAKSVFYTENGIQKKLTDEIRNRILSSVEKMSNKALRTIALAYRSVPENTEEFSFAFANDLVFAGVVGMKDPIRPEVSEAIQKAIGAGIRVIMATGDHKATAFSIAQEIGLVSKDADISKVARTESEIESLSETELQKIVKTVSVFARLSPTMKLRIAEALKKDGYTIAMTGDGVNDAPVLKRADIGIAMGNIGTDVAREASQVVLIDDNFATIISAIEEGRGVFVNTRQASSFLVTTNFAEQGTILLTLILGMPLPLIPIQILWLNLVTDGVAGIPLANEPSHHDVLSLPPRKKEENILSVEIIPFLILMVVIMAGLTIFIFSLFLPDGLDKARTGAFAVMTFTQLFNMFNMRSLHRSVFSIGIFTNPYIIVGLFVSLVLQLLVFYTPFFQNIFKFAPLSTSEFLMIIILSSSVLLFGELYKLARNLWSNRVRV